LAGTGSVGRDPGRASALGAGQLLILSLILDPNLLLFPVSV